MLWDALWLCPKPVVTAAACRGKRHEGRSPHSPPHPSGLTLGLYCRLWHSFSSLFILRDVACFILFSASGIEMMSWSAAAAAAAKSLQSCLTLCDPIDGSPPGSPVPGILQARTLEWVSIAFSNAWQWKVKVKSLSRVRLLATPRTAAHQAPPSTGFSRQEYWSGVPLPSPKCWLTTENFEYY